MWRAGNGAQTIQRARATTYSRMRLVVVRRTKICLHIKHSTSGEELLKRCASTYKALCKVAYCYVIFLRQHSLSFACMRLLSCCCSNHTRYFGSNPHFFQFRYPMLNTLDVYGSEFALPSRLRSESDIERIKPYASTYTKSCMVASCCVPHCCRQAQSCHLNKPISLHYSYSSLRQMPYRNHN